jgi:hypothetical protein
MILLIQSNAFVEVRNTVIAGLLILLLLEQFINGGEPTTLLTQRHTLACL